MATKNKETTPLMSRASTGGSDDKLLDERQPSRSHEVTTTAPISSQPPLLTPHRPHHVIEIAATGTTITTVMASALEMIARLLERQVTSPPNVNPMNITTTLDLTSTLPTHSGKETESFEDWLAAIESMRDRLAWNNPATLSIAKSRLRRRAFEWHCTDSMRHTKPYGQQQSNRNLTSLSFFANGSPT